MSRRPTDKAAQNQQVIKNLLKLEANKNCADCKRNKHPRWASWNLGVFICIRCSGIHRGMGTHISRVKSVDLDAWTDEQLQSIMKWGNARANRYWESKLAAGHVPSDAKIENFIRTKYESRRWVMEGSMPDPSTLGGDGDEDVPLTTVQERARLDRSASQRASSSEQPASQIRQLQAGLGSSSFNLIDSDDPVSVPPRANTTEPPSTNRPAAPSSRTAAGQPSQLLGGLDFLGGPPERPPSASTGLGSMSRPDLKQSILSLYASKPLSQSSVQSPLVHSRQTSTIDPSIGVDGHTRGSLDDAFGSLTFGSSSSFKNLPATTQTSNSVSVQKSAFAPAPRAQPAKPDAYAALSSVLSSNQSSSVSLQPQTSSPLSGGAFFDTGTKLSSKTAAPATKSTNLQPVLTQASSDDWGDFSIASEPKSSQVQSMPIGNKNGLLDFTSEAATKFHAPQIANTQKTANNSVFNLSAKAAPAASSNVPMSNTSQPSNPWGVDEWSPSDNAPIISQAQSTTSPKATSNESNWSPPSNWATSNVNPSSPIKINAFDSGGWGEPAAPVSAGNGLGELAPQPANTSKVQAEEDIGGGWGNSSTVLARPELQRQSNQAQTSGGGISSNSDDLFANVWG